MSFFLHFLLYIGTVCYFFGSGLDALKDNDLGGIDKRRKNGVILLWSFIWPVISLGVLVYVAKHVIETVLDHWFPDGK